MSFTGTIFKPLLHLISFFSHVAIFTDTPTPVSCKVNKTLVKFRHHPSILISVRFDIDIVSHILIGRSISIVRHTVMPSLSQVLCLLLALHDALCELNLYFDVTGCVWKFKPKTKNRQSSPLGLPQAAKAY